MTSIASTNATLPAAAQSAALAKSSADFNMFLKLLTTQMQNQDPLDPMETSEYTQQLVQYSQVEQTIQQTETLKSILSSLSTQDMAQASSLIGRDVVFASAQSGLTAATPAAWSYQAERPITSLVATISDGSGKVVDTRTITVEEKSGRFSWDGNATTGAKLPEGQYALALLGRDNAGNDVKVNVNSIGKVREVTTASGVINLGVNGIELPASSLVKVAQPDE
ncbi:flagellar hook assembly protein FlgD [Sphingomonas sp. CCH5-D11]|uniref:flagellar hook assembly protein FlgD n=1 Tax=Sphingomonas sp. CCH5-D11 TaxID=1768786 RepID=UPI00082A2837|nr:flagellar hook assembly protein FlgD [Sphingomonas sp. CCH5-D11]